MIDLHSHLLYGIDDGSSSLDESYEIVKNAIRNGVTDIVVTPHFIFESDFSCNNKKKEQLFKELLNKTKDLDISLYLGNEVYFVSNLSNLKNEFLTLNKTKYLLLEFSREFKPNNLLNEIYELQLAGYQIIIAHPERYAYFQSNINKLVPLLKMGVLFQGNIGSLFDQYGKKSNKALKLMIKHNMIHFLATDSHKKNDGRYDLLEKLQKKLNQDDINELTFINPLCVLNNKSINIKKYKECKYIFKTIFNKYKVK